MQLVESSDEERAERKKDEESAERWNAARSGRPFGSHGILKLRPSSEHKETLKLEAAAEADNSEAQGTRDEKAFEEDEKSFNEDEKAREADQKTPEEQGKNVAEGGKTVAEDKNGISPTPILTQKCPINNPEIIPNDQKWFLGCARMILFLFVQFQIPDFQILEFSDFQTFLKRAWAWA